MGDEDYMKILYVTDNEKKVKELKEILKKTMEINTIDSLFDLDYGLKDLEYTRDLETAAYNKTRYIWKKEKNNYDYIIGEEFGLFSENAPNILGVDSDCWWPGTQRDKNDALIRLFDGIKDREIYYKSVFVAMDETGHTITSEGFTYGYLGKKVKERNGSGYDSVMILEDGKYLSHHSTEEISSVNARTIAIEFLVDKLKKKD